MLAVDEQAEGGVLDDLAVENDDDVVPLALLDQVRKPDPGSEVSGEVRMPITAFAHRSCKSNKNAHICLAELFDVLM